MNDSPDDAASSGQLRRAVGQSLQPAPVDCSSWDADIPAERWSTGRLVRATQPQPATPGPFLSAAFALEIALRLKPDVSPSEAFALATQVLAAAFMHDLGHGLSCAAQHSSAQPDEVVLVLTPQQPEPDVEARLLRLSELIRQAASAADGIAVNEIRVRPAA